ncbi:MAG: amidase, partial [Leeuwenhoekiella sp.]
MIKKITLSIFSLLIITACSSHRFSRNDVKHAQKMYGLDFKGDKIKTMHGYLERNLSAYDSLRATPIDVNVFPALYFDPRPKDFKMPEAAEANYEWQPEPVEMPENREKLAFFSIRQLAFLLKNQKITSVELTKIYLNRIKKYDKQLEAVITVTEDLALEQASKADAEIKNGNYKGLLHGIPYGVKDLMAVKGYKTTWGAAPYQDQQFAETASVVKQLEAAGAVLIAKLVSGSLARGDVWFNGKTKNPWDLSQGASGSSAGSASATAAGLVAFSLGTETLGSIVSPSNKCGLSGLRPTYGRVSRTGVMSLSWSMDKVGTICRSAEDCAIVFKYILGKTEDDKSIIEAPYSANPARDIKSLKVAYLAADFKKDTS